MLHTADHFFCENLDIYLGTMTWLVTGVDGPSGIPGTIPVGRWPNVGRSGPLCLSVFFFFSKFPPIGLANWLQRTSSVLPASPHTIGLFVCHCQSIMGWQAQIALTVLSITTRTRVGPGWDLDGRTGQAAAEPVVTLLSMVVVSIIETVVSATWKWVRGRNARVVLRNSD